MNDHIYIDSGANLAVVQKSTTIRFDGVDDISIVIDRPMSVIEIIVEMVNMLNRFSDAVNAGRRNVETTQPQSPALLDKVRMWLFGE